MFGSKHSNKKPAEAGLVGNKKAHVLDGFTLLVQPLVPSLELHRKKFVDPLKTKQLMSLAGPIEIICYA
jgi:hypothetical protein